MWLTTSIAGNDRGPVRDAIRLTPSGPDMWIRLYFAFPRNSPLSSHSRRRPVRPSTRVCTRDKRQDLRDFALPVRSRNSQPAYSADLRYWTRWQLPKFRQVPTSVHVACVPSRVQLQPNCPHHACWLLAIWRYASDVVLTRVPDVAQADNSAQRTTVASNPLFAFIMAYLSMSKMRLEQGHPAFAPLERRRLQRKQPPSIRPKLQGFRSSVSRAAILVQLQ